MRQVVTTLTELFGFTAIVGGLWMVSVPAAVIVAGVVLVVIGAWQGNQ